MSTIKDRIINSPELQAARKARDLDALRAGLNAQGVTATQSRFVNARTIQVECQDADAIMQQLDTASTTNANIKTMMAFLRQESGLDVGHPRTQTAINNLVPTVLTATQAQQLKNMALLPVVVTRADVEAAMFNADGTEK